MPANNTVVERRIIEVQALTTDAAEGLKLFLSTLKEVDAQLTVSSDALSRSVQSFNAHAQAVRAIGEAWAAAAEKGQTFLNIAEKTASVNFRVPEIPTQNLPVGGGPVRSTAVPVSHGGNLSSRGYNDTVSDAERVWLENQLRAEQQRAAMKAESERIRRRVYDAKPSVSDLSVLDYSSLEYFQRAASDILTGETPDSHITHLMKSARIRHDPYVDYAGAYFKEGAPLEIGLSQAVNPFRQANFFNRFSGDNISATGALINRGMLLHEMGHEFDWITANFGGRTITESLPESSKDLELLAENVRQNYPETYSRFHRTWGDYYSTAADRYFDKYGEYPSWYSVGQGPIAKAKSKSQYINTALGGEMFAEGFAYQRLGYDTLQPIEELLNRRYNEYVTSGIQQSSAIMQRYVKEGPSLYDFARNFAQTDTLRGVEQFDQYYKNLSDRMIVAPSMLDELARQQAQLDDYGRQVLPHQIASNGNPIRYKYDQEAFGGAPISAQPIDYSGLPWNIKGSYTQYNNWIDSGGNGQMPWNVKGALAQIKKWEAANSRVGLSGDGVEWNQPPGPQQFDPFGIYGEGELNTRRERFQQQLEYMAERRRQQAEYNAFRSDPSVRPIYDQMQLEYEQLFGGNDPYGAARLDPLRERLHNQRQSMYEQLFAGPGDVNGFYFPQRQQSLRIPSWSPTETAYGEFYERSIGSRRMYEQMGHKWDEIGQINPDLAAQMEKQAGATRSVAQVMAEYDRGLITAAERNAELQRILDGTNEKMGQQGKHAQNMWQASFLLFGVAMAWQTVGREIEKVSGEKMPEWFSIGGNAINIGSSLGMTGAMLGPMLGIGGMAGLGIGAAAGIGIGILSGMAELPEDIRALNDELDKLDKKDTILTALASVMGTTTDQADEILRLAKAYSELGSSLDKVARQREQPSMLEGLTGGMGHGGVFATGWDLTMQYRDWTEPFTMAFTMPDENARKAELYRRYREKYDFNEMEYSQQLFNARFLDSYSGLSSTVSNRAGGDASSQFRRMTGSEDFSYYEKLAKADSDFAAQLERSTQKMMAFRGSMEANPLNDYQAGLRGITDEMKNLDAAAQRAQEKLTAIGDRSPDRSLWGGGGSRSNGGWSFGSASDIRSNAALGMPMLEQYRNQLVASGADVSGLNQSWSTVNVLIDQATGKLSVFTGKELEAAQMGKQISEAMKTQDLGLSFSDMKPDEMSRAMRIGLSQLDRYRSSMQTAGLSTADLDNKWKGIGFIINTATGGLSQFNGKQLEALSIGAQLLAQQQKIANAWSHPSIQTMPELNAGNAPQLQAYISQFEKLLSAQGVQQDPQRFLMFGQNGFMAQFVTSSDAMTLALALLREQIDQQTEATKDNTKKSEQLRGHYNIPTEFGYKPPTPWEVADKYKNNGWDMSGLMGPVNYPWMFPDKNGASGGSSMNALKAMLGSVPTDLKEYPTTLSMQSVQQANTLATQANTSALLANTASRTGGASGNAAFQGFPIGALTYPQGALMNYIWSQDAAGGGGGESWADPLRGMATRRSQDFGMRPDFYKKYGLAGHEGLDFAAAEGTPIYPVAGGTIKSIGYGNTYGNQIVQELANGMGTVLYAHLKELPNLKVGQQVDMNTLLGLVGNTGNSSGPHLHLGFKPSDPKMAPEGFGGWADPSKYFGDGASNAPVAVTGIPAIQSNTQRAATSSQQMAAQIPTSLSEVTTTIGVGNSILTQMLAQLQLIRGLVARPLPTPIVNVQVGTGSGFGVGGGIGTSFENQATGLGDSKYMAGGGYIR